MSTKQLNIDILARDKSRQALKSVQGNLNQTKQSVLNLKNALIGLGVGAAIKSFVDVGKEVESLQTRFKFLFGSAEQGSVAFDNLTKFAAKVPFSLQEISRASGNLAVVAEDANDLNRILEITGNVAAVTGLDFETTSSQIQRAFSGGIGAADLFRERGVRALLGFQAGATVTAEETVARFEELFAGDGRFAGATDDLAQTLEGTLSMLGDKFFKFQKAVSAGFFDELKTEFGSLDKFLEDNAEQIEAIGKDIGQTLGNAFTVFSGAVRIAGQNSALLFDILKLLIGLKLISFTLNAAKGFTLLATAITSAAFASNVLNSSLLLIPKRFAKVLGVINLMAQENQSLRGDVFDLVDQLGELANSIKTISAEMSAQMNETDNLGGETLRLTKIFEKQQEALEELTKKQEENNKEKELSAQTLLYLSKGYSTVNTELRGFNAGLVDNSDLIESLNQSKFPQFQQTLKDAGDTTKQLDGLFTSTFNGFADTLADAIVTGKFAFKDFANAVIADIARIIAKQLTLLAIQKSLGFFGVGSIFGVPVGDIFGFANGGRPPVGQPSIVGERGPELFVPDSAGTIIPNEKLGGQQNVNVNFTINAVDTRGFRTLLRSERGTIVSLINQAVTDKGREAII